MRQLLILLMAVGPLMAANVTAKGSCLLSGTATCSTASFTLTTGSTLIVWSSTVGLPHTMTAAWNSNSGVEIASGIGAGNVEQHVLKFENVTGGTNTAACTTSDSSNTTGVCVALAVTDVGTASPVEFYSGFNTAASTGGTTNSGTGSVSSDSILIAMMARNTLPTDTSGTWGGSFVNSGSYLGQASGACCEANWATQNPAAATTTATKSGMTAADTCIFMLSVKSGSGGASNRPRRAVVVQ
jgi:hypothetical protein